MPSYEEFDDLTRRQTSDSLLHEINFDERGGEVDADGRPLDKYSTSKESISVAFFFNGLS